MQLNSIKILLRSKKISLKKQRILRVCSLVEKLNEINQNMSKIFVVLYANLDYKKKDSMRIS